MKIIYVVLIAFILTAESSAQFKFGMEAGLNISKIKGSDPSSCKPRGIDSGF
jgi:hypothetical protein